jgi:glycosyltransferase involved in cell wall biosynthesis
LSLEASVIIPTFNRRHLVGGAIESVLAQSISDFELIVVDDGSADGTLEYLESVAARANQVRGEQFMRIVRTANRGVAAARNRGAALARAALICFLDSDDRWSPQKLGRQLTFMDENPECMISQVDEVWFHNGRLRNPGRRHLKRAGDIFVDSLRTCLISPSAVILRTALFRRFGGFDEDLIAAEDYDLWLRILKDYPVGLVPEKHVTRNSGHAGQLSAEVPAIDRFRILTLLKLLASAELTGPQCLAVSDVLSEKCRIYAKGLARRGADDGARFMLDLEQAAHDHEQAGRARDARIGCLAAAMRTRLGRGISGNG